MNKKYVKIGWTLYYEDQYGNYLDWEGYNPSGYKWTGTTWIDKEGYTPIRYKSSEGDDIILVILDNPIFFAWEIKAETLINCNIEELYMF